MKSILVLRGGALGDFIVTLPALAILRQRWPQAQVHWVGNQTAASLGVGAGLIHTAASQHAAPWHQLFTAKLKPDFGEQLARFDLVINFWPDPDGTIARHFPRHAQQLFLSAPALPALAPASAHYAAALQPLGLPAPAPLYPLRLPEAGADLIAIHPGSGSPRKNWPPERWHALAGWLETQWPGKLRVIRGEAEAPHLLAEAGTAWANLPLPQLADQLARCRFFIGHDSGVSHLAAACGCRGLLLFGPTDPARWAPPTTRMHVLRQGPRLDLITVRDVQRSVTAALPDQT